MKPHALRRRTKTKMIKIKRNDGMEGGREKGMRSDIFKLKLGFNASEPRSLVNKIYSRF